MDYFKVVTDYINNRDSFEFLGSGADRNAYAHYQTGLVLKHDKEQGQNLDEWNTYNLIKENHSSIAHLVADIYYGDEDYIVMERANETLCDKAYRYDFDAMNLDRDEYLELCATVQEEVLDSCVDIECDINNLIGMKFEAPHVYQALIDFLDELDGVRYLKDMHDENIGWFESEGVFKIIDLGYFDSEDWKIN